MSIDWIKEAKRLFSCEKPDHFTDYKHCEECLEHDETLLGRTIDTIGLEELGSPGWDPLCFCTAEGIKYYMPALIRLSLTTIKDEFYLEQLLFHLERDGRNNDLVVACSKEQREFIVKFIEYILLNYTNELECNCCENEVLRVLEIWTSA